jgi:membrane protease subunit HflK
MGIRILGVKLTGVNVPEAVQDAQRDAIKAGKDRQRYQQDAEKYRSDVLPRARGAAAKEVLDAEAYRLQVLAVAQGETARFDQVLSQYERAPAVTRERMYLATMENVYKNSRKVIVDTKSGNSMMYLPLDKLIAPGPQSISMPNDTMTVPPGRVPEIQVAPVDDPARARGVR